MEFACNKARNLHRNIEKFKGTYVQACERFFRPSNRTTQEQVVTSRLEGREFIVDSGASLHMTSKSELTSGEKETIRRSKEPTVISRRFNDLDVFVTMMLLEDLPRSVCEELGNSFEWKRREYRWKVLKCMSENHVPIVAVSQEPRIPDDPSKVSGNEVKIQVPGHQETGREKFFNPTSQDRRAQARHRAADCMSQVSRHRETDRVRFQNGFNLS